MLLRLALAQINTTVGDLAGNRDKIIRCLEEARSRQADLVLFPELALTGYPPEDLLLKPDFVGSAMAHLEELIPASAGLTAVVGTPWVDERPLQRRGGAERWPPGGSLPQALPAQLRGVR